MPTFSDQLESIRAAGRYRSMKRVDSPQESRLLIDGSLVTVLCSNNYLGIANHPRLKTAAAAAVESYGVGSGAARLVSGNMALHESLEQRLASFKGTEAALVMNGGYAANLGIIAAVVGRGDTIYSDRLNHASIVDGALLSQARLVRFRHGDAAHLQQLLEKDSSGGRKLIVTDGVFSMDGDIAPLQQLVEIKRSFGALLMVDDAHGTGVLGVRGRGSCEECRVVEDVDIQMGTLGKAVGSFGAYVAGSGSLIDFLRNTARSFIFSTSLPPAVLAASLAGIELIDSDEGAVLRDRLRDNARQFRLLLQDRGFDTMGSETHIVPVRTGDERLTMEFSSRLFAAGYFVQGIRPPTVPQGTCRLRCTVMASHTPDELSSAAAAMAEIGRALGVI
jgi:glycine C-acetyltransferase